MSTTAIPDRFTTLPDEPALQATVVALEEHGFSVEVVGDLDAARQAVLARIPEGSSVMTSYLPPSGPRPVDRAWLGRRDEKEDFTMCTNVQRLGEHVTAVLLGQVTP